ncbi:flagellar biosynthesis anti-sigma factor FlgM [Helicobacter rodentium]|uniref:flagellar biosynthesis anti-sigma factor FlgM n=1 Tax=Helicobacter rodentium TaxID=59617 RepID=UPI00047BCBA9|nr:flagellar biosynthesis anti-sigma factor FlgM [Helicobacter rodentium]
MISHLMSNSAFSSAVNQVNNKNTSQINNTKNESVSEKPQSVQSAKDSSNARLEEIKSAIKNGTYKLDLRGSAEKLAQELLR